MNALDLKIGIVAILDALGAATFEDAEIRRFLQSRDKVITLLKDKSEKLAEALEVPTVATYTFNDTLLICMESHNDAPSMGELQAFVQLLRKLLVDAMGRRILFRGSFAIGTFYEHSESNTILGKAVTDAAAWYDKMDLVGVIATPRSSMIIDKMNEVEYPRVNQHTFMKYDVPLTGGVTRELWTANWPKAFWVPAISPAIRGETPRQTFLRLLTEFSVPRGTEAKYFNTIEYFDTSWKMLKLKNVRTRQSNVPVTRGTSTA